MISLTKKTIVLTLFAVCMLINSVAMAAANSKVSGGKHDFSIAFSLAAQNKDTQQSQVCVFCHTPHNAGQTRLLWNKAGNGNINFRLYTSSATISAYTKASTLTASSPSILCLSCHDGKTAMNVLHASGTGSLASDIVSLTGYPVGSRLVSGNTPNIMGNIEASELTGWIAYTPNLGGATGVDLTNDHPIGFSYTDVLSDGPHAATLNDLGQVDTKSTGRIRFYGTKKSVECSSCHDPHIDSAIANQRPFLVMDNIGSKLCLSCHNK